MILKVLVGGEITETALAVGGALLFSLFIIYDTQVHSMQYTVCSTQYAVHSMQYKVCSTQYAVHSIQYTVHGTRYADVILKSVVLFSSKTIIMKRVES